MAVRIEGRYDGDLKTTLEHAPSGATIRTSAPKDNRGDGSLFSPTDLAAAGLGACMLTLIAIVGEREGLRLEGLAFELEKHMRADPRRIDRIPIRVRMPAGLSGDQRKRLEQAALGCPVTASLSPDVRVEARFDYPD